MLTIERQAPDLALGVAVLSHAVIVAAVIWKSAIGMPTALVRLDEPAQAEATTDIIMLAGTLTGLVKASASAVVHKPLPKAPEFRIPESADGDVLTVRQSNLPADDFAMWALPVFPERDTTPRELDLDQLADAPPRFTAISRAPRLRNEHHIRSYLNKNFPAALRQSGGDVLVVVWLLVDQHGKVFKAVLPVTSGRNDADSVAVKATYLMEFKPAEQAGRALPVWVQQPVRFRVQDIY